jgi:hypothetical protein
MPKAKKEKTGLKKEKVKYKRRRYLLHVEQEGNELLVNL